MNVPKKDGALLRHVLCLLEGGHRFNDTLLIHVGRKTREQKCCSRCGLYDGKARWYTTRSKR